MRIHGIQADELAVQFCYLNNKKNRGRLHEFMLAVGPTRGELLRFLARFTAILSQYVSHVTTADRKGELSTTLYSFLYIIFYTC